MLVLKSNASHGERVAHGTARGLPQLHAPRDVNETGGAGLALGTLPQSVVSVYRSRWMCSYLQAAAVYHPQRPQRTMSWYTRVDAPRPLRHTSRRILASGPFSTSRPRVLAARIRHTSQTISGKLARRRPVSNVQLLRSITAKWRVVRLRPFPRVSRWRPRASSARDRRALKP